MEPITDQEEYLALFRGVDQHHKAIGEASTSYLWDLQAPERIKAKVPEAKIIIILRDPVERAFSHYLLDVREGIQQAPFFEALVEDYASPQKGWGVSHLYVELGLYYEQVRRYLHHFGREQILVLLFEEFAANTHSCLEQVLSFLGVDKSGLDRMESERRYNVYAEPRTRLSHLMLSSVALRTVSHKLLPKRIRTILHDRVFLRKVPKGQIDPRASEFLSKIYQPDVVCLETLLGVQLPWKIGSEESALDGNNL